MRSEVLNLFSGKSRRETFSSGVKPTGYRRDGPLPCVEINSTGIIGDELADDRSLGRKNHALYLFNADHYAAYETVLARRLMPGAFAENVLYSGPDEDEFRIGDILAIGDVVLQITTPRIPCFKLRHFLDTHQGFPAEFSASGKTGFYTLVQRGGMISPGNEIRLVSTNSENATVADLNNVMTQFDFDPEMIQRVLGSPDLLPKAADAIRQRVLRYQPELAVRPVAGRIVSQHKISEDTAVLEVTTGSDKISAGMPGQFITLGVPDTNGDMRFRCYSLIAGPSIAGPSIAGPSPDIQSAPFAIAVRADRGKSFDGSVSAQLVRPDIVGLPVTLYPPSGNFLLPEVLPEELLYIAGGIGITPILSHLRHLAEADNGPKVRLVYISRSLDAAVFHAELRALFKAWGSFTYELFVTGKADFGDTPNIFGGRPDMTEVIGAASLDAEVFVCGPLGLIEDVRLVHQQTGRPNIALHFELFDPPLDTGDSDATAKIATIELASTQQTGQWKPEDGSILEWLEAKTDYRPPAACRSGLCRTCIAPLETGVVVYPKGITAPPLDRVLLCCARPQTDRIVIGLPEGTRTIGTASQINKPKELS